MLMHGLGSRKAAPALASALSSMAVATGPRCRTETADSRSQATLQSASSFHRRRTRRSRRVQIRGDIDRSAAVGGGEGRSLLTPFVCCEAVTSTILKPSLDFGPGEDATRCCVWVTPQMDIRFLRHHLPPAKAALMASIGQASRPLSRTGLMIFSFIAHPRRVCGLRFR